MTRQSSVPIGSMCPCGAGASVGHRCLGAADVANIATSPVWVVDVIRVTPPGPGDPAARTMAVLVAADDVLLYAHLLTNPPAEPDAFAELLHGALASAERSTGLTPAGVVVRNRKVAAALSGRLEQRGIVVAACELPHVMGRVARAYDTALSGSSHETPDVAPPPTWGAWGLDHRRVGRLFRVAQAFHTCEPLRQIIQGHTLDISTARGSRWHAALLGTPDQNTGVVLCKTVLDLIQGFKTKGAEQYHAVMHGLGAPTNVIPNSFSTPSLWLSLEPEASLPLPMQFEVAHRRWPVSPGAYPRLLAMNTPGNGVSMDDLNDLIDVLEAVPRFVSARRTMIARTVEFGGTLAWTDTITGLKVQFAGGDLVAAEMTANMRAESRGVIGPHESGARPGVRYAAGDDLAACATIERKIVAQFVEWAQHHDEGPHVSETEAERHGRFALLLVDYMVFGARAPLAAITEVDLRRFLHGEWPRKTDSFIETAELVESLSLFFRYLPFHDLYCWIWPEEILDDTRRLARRCIMYAQLSDTPDRLAAWKLELEEELEKVWLTPRRQLSNGGVNWREANGPLGRELWHELSRLWLKWYDEIVGTDATTVRSFLNLFEACQAQWERAPKAAYGGLSPAQIVEGERLST